MQNILLTLVLSFLAVFATETHAGWDDYKQKTLEATIKEHKDILGTSDFNYTPGLPQLVMAKYTGETRNAPQDHETVIRGWVKMIGQKSEVAALFLQQFKFVENGKEYWLAVQKPLIPHLEKELQEGGPVWLYVVWIGTTKTDWVFVVNEFKKAERKKL